MAQTKAAATAASAWPPRATLVITSGFNANATTADAGPQRIPGPCEIRTSPHTASAPKPSAIPFTRKRATTGSFDASPTQPATASDQSGP